MLRSPQEEYEAYIRERDEEFGLIGKKYEPETVPDMARRLYPFEWASDESSDPVLAPWWKTSIVVAIVSTVLSFFVIFFAIIALAGYLVFFLTYPSIRGKSSKKIKRQNDIYAALVEYRTPLEENGLRHLLDWYMGTKVGYRTDTGTTLFPRFATEKVPEDPKVLHSATWLNDMLGEALHFKSISDRHGIVGRGKGSEKVHLAEADAELKPLLEDLSSMFYQVIRAYSEKCHYAYEESIYGERESKYRSIALGAKDNLDESTYMYADKTAKCAESSRRNAKNLGYRASISYNVSLEDYKRIIGYINDISARVPGIVAKMDAAKALDGLSLDSKEIHRLLDTEEGLMDLA